MSDFRILYPVGVSWSPEPVIALELTVEKAAALHDIGVGLLDDAIVQALGAVVDRARGGGR